VRTGAAGCALAAADRPGRAGLDNIAGQFEPGPVKAG